MQNKKPAVFVLIMLVMKAQPSGPKLPDVDPYSRRLGVGAEVWKTYVDEADKWDKEMTDGWNKLGLQLLMFVGAFSLTALLTGCLT